MVELCLDISIRHLQACPRANVMITRKNLHDARAFVIMK
ncbi:hypothetical protein HMPREF9248_0873 [Fannyhessea vaginae PB189-T1-4]|uniref:Uncharacterized protein n=1 Tax=Fannyhessea vaginae PB189-T1-4 TaxID=866774 RepID=A0ABN0B0L2_9ACTN|nr:hypothetical protein HMPREF9248_0873 [Fannyhessea vaginae PB189-T1-4]